MQREARWGATIPGTGASGATGHVGEMRGITAVPPWSRQAGGEADGGEEGAARGGAQRGESEGEAEMALGAAGRTPARAATPRGNTLRLGEPKGGGAAGRGAEGSRAYLACSAQHDERNRDGGLGGGNSLPARAMRGRKSGGEGQ